MEGTVKSKYQRSILRHFQYYIVYVVWDLLEAFIIWLCVVETKGRTL